MSEPRKLSKLLIPLLLVFASCTPASQPPHPRHILLITVDTLRADHLGLYGYSRPTSPIIDALGSEGVVFENAIVQWPVTTPSMASMFSGTYPHVSGIVVAAGDNWVPPRMLLLAEALTQRGFRTAGVVANGVLGRHNNFAQGFETYRELWKGTGSVGEQTDANRVTDAALVELERLSGGGDPFLLWVHYIDPHTPYEPPTGYAQRFLEDEHYRERRVPVNPGSDPWRGIPKALAAGDASDDDLGRHVAAYDGEIRYADEQIGRLLAALRALPASAETLVVLTSDHGESLGEHDTYLNHGHLSFEEQIRVPLLFRWPDRRHAGRRIDAPVELRGLARTLLAAVGTPPADNPFSGADLLPAMRTGRTDALPEAVFSESGGRETRWHRSYTLSLRRGETKLVLPRSPWARERHGGKDLQLFDLARDPGELRDVGPDRTAEATALRDELLTWFHAEEPWKRRTRYDPTRADGRTEAALRELGYAE